MKIQAITALKAGPAEVLQLAENTISLPEADEIIVETKSVGVNFIETYQRSGVYPVSFPFIPGTEASGVVHSVGSAVKNIVPGSRVVTASAVGSYATFFRVKAEKVAVIPDSISFEDAAAVALQGATAHYLARSIASLKPGDTALVHAGAGGVGGLLTQILKNDGVHVISTAGSSEKRERSLGYGAEDSLAYEAFSERVRELTGGVGVDVVFDGVGKTTFDGSLASLKRRGMLVLFGGASGQVPPLDPQVLSQAGSVFLTRPTLVDYMANAEEIAWRFSELFGMLESGDLRVNIAKTFPLREAAHAHEAIVGREFAGKILLTL